jgi:predicted metal-dependent TIM-barrel fold hydrolase
MIEAKDIEKMPLSDEVVQTCLQHPLPQCTSVATGQLKAIGERVLQHISGLDDETFNMQLEGAREMGVSCVCEAGSGKSIGLSATVSLIKDHAVYDKQVVVPSGQLRRHKYLDAHNTVAVYVVGEKDANKKVAKVDAVYAAGWIPVYALRRWLQHGGKGQFQVPNMTLAVAPVHLFNPLSKLTSMIRWSEVSV